MNKANILYSKTHLYIETYTEKQTHTQMQNIYKMLIMINSIVVGK